MRFKKLLLAISFALLTIGLIACTGENENTGSDESNDEGASGGETTLHLAALESAYGADMWKKVAENYEAEHENVKVELTIEKNLEEVIRPKCRLETTQMLFYWQPVENRH